MCEFSDSYTFLDFRTETRTTSIFFETRIVVRIYRPGGGSGGGNDQLLDNVR